MNRKPTYEELEKRVHELECCIEKASSLNITEQEYPPPSKKPLRGTDERFRVTFERAGIGMAIFNLKGRVLDSNAALQRMLDYNGEELSGMSFRDFTHPEDFQKDWELSQKLFAGEGNSYQIEKRYIRKDKQVLWGRLTASIVRDDKGKPKFGIGMVENITDHKRIEEKLRENEERFRSLSDSNIIGVVLADPVSGQVFDANDEFLRIVGHSRDELLAGVINWRARTPPEHLALEDSLHNTRPCNSRVSSYEKAYIRPDGTIVPVIIGGSFLPDSSHRVIAFALDITNRKRAETAASESEKIMRYIIKHDPNAIAVYDKNLRYIAVSDRYLQDYSVLESDILGKHHYEVFPEMPQRWKEVHQRVLSGATERNEDDHFERPDGSVTYNRWECRPWYMADESIGGMITYTEVTTDRKLSEMALLESDQRLKLALDSVSDAVWDWKVDTGQVYFSSRWYTMLGYEPNELPQEFDTWRRLLHPDDLPQAEERVFQHLESGDPFESEFRMLTKEGNWRWILGRGKTVERNERGNPTRMLGTHVDITERKQAESEREITISILQALHKKNDLRALIRDITTLIQNWSGCEAVGIRLQEGHDYPYFETRGFSSKFVEAERSLCAIDPKGNLICDRAGNPVLECMCGNVIRERFNPDLPFFTRYGSFWTNSTTDLLASTTESDRLARTRNRCHGEGFESVALIPLSTGKQSMGLLQLNDSRKDRFDEQKLAIFERLASSVAIGLSQRTTALALRESEEKYRSMMESMEDATYICSHDFRIEYMNPAMIRWIGRDATGESCHAAIHELVEKCPWCVHEKVKQGNPITNEIVSPRDDKTYFVSSSPILHTDGSISKLTVFRDITEVKQLERRLLQAQKMESIGTLAGGIAHDFNNILFPIMGMSELLLEDLPPDSQEYEKAQEIFKAGKRASDLIKQILAFSRQTDHQKIPIRIQNILNDALKLARSTIPSNIEIGQDIQKCDLVMADATQVHQIAMNLITNAYHAVEQTTDGKISIELKEIALEKEALEGRPLLPGRYALLSVSDTGCGIDPLIVDKIFEPYFTTKEQGKGTGLGLSVVYGIVKKHRGDIKVYSEVGKGTIFNVYLPLIEKSRLTTADGKTEAYETGSERILLVDDEGPIVHLERQMLKRLGYQVTTRTSSMDALDAFRANPKSFDLVITDMTMPNMMGDQLARELISIRPRIPIIICTGFSERINQEKAAASGIKGFLMKPIVRSEMARMIRKVLDEAKSSV